MARIFSAGLLLAILAGCGGGDAGGGSSLQEQHQQAIQLNDARSRSIRLIQIAYKRHEAGDVQGAQESVAAAAEAARAIESKDEQAETLASVAYAAGTVGWMTEASKLVKEVRSAVEQAPSKEIAAAALAKVAVVYGKHLDNPTAAETYLQQAEEMAGQIEAPEGRATALLAIAGRYHELQNADAAQRVSDAALELARTVADPRRRAETLAEAGVRLQKIAQAESSQAVFDEAEAAADSLSDNLVSHAYALLAVADRLQAAGQTARAVTVAQKAEDVIFKIPDPGEQEPLLAQLTKQRDKLP